MQSIHQDLDDLDRLVANGAAVDQIRSQIRLISREASAIQEYHARLAEERAALESQNASLASELSEIKAKNQRGLEDWLAQQAARYQAMLRRHELNYNVK